MNGFGKVLDGRVATQSLMIATTTGSISRIHSGGSQH
jgi:hypothetical protein